MSTAQIYVTGITNVFRAFQLAKLSHSSASVCKWEKQTPSGNVKCITSLRQFKGVDFVFECFCSFSDEIIFWGCLYAFLIQSWCQKLWWEWRSATELQALGRRWSSPYFEVQYNNKKRVWQSNGIDGPPALKKSLHRFRCHSKNSWDLVIKKEDK